jgi:hypothetical protein
MTSGNTVATERKAIACALPMKPVPIRPNRRLVTAVHHSLVFEGQVSRQFIVIQGMRGSSLEKLTVLDWNKYFNHILL